MEIQEIVDLHGKLAERIKQFETSLDTFLPAEVGNELRYALRAVVEILSIIENEEKNSDCSLDESKQKAYHALICAYHDLVDGLALHITVTLESLQKEYLEESIFVLGDKRREIIDFLNEVNDKIALSRKVPMDRKKIYEEQLYDQYFLQLIEYRKHLTGSVLEDVVVLHERRRKEKEAQTNKYIFTTLIAVAGLLATVISIV